MLLYNAHSRHVEELTLVKRGKASPNWVVTVPKFELQEKRHNFSPEGVKSCFENSAYLKVFQYYCVRGYSIRYSSSMGVDCYQMFIKNGGIYTSLETLAYGAKLHLLTECIPIAYLIEKAKGVASDGDANILDIVIEGVEQKSTFIAGSRGEVEFVNTTLKCGGDNVKSLDEEAKLLLLEKGLMP